MTQGGGPGLVWAIPPWLRRATPCLHYGHTEVAQHLQAASMKATGSVPTKPSSPTSPLGSSFGFSQAGYDDEVEEVYGPKKPVYGQVCPPPAPPPR